MKPIHTLISYIKLSVAELKKVSFPTQSQTINRTLLVIGAIVVATVLIGTLDSGITQFIKIFILKRGV